MNDLSKISDLKVRIKGLGLQTLAIICDAVFLCLWVCVQFLVDRFVMKQLELSGINAWVLLVFQLVFAVSTLIPVILYIYTDVRVMILRAKKQIKLEERFLDESGVDTHGQ